MTARYLLDTNILSDLIRNPQGPVAERIAAVGEETICTSIIVAAELRFGGAKSGSLKLIERINLLLSAVDILSLEVPVDRYYGEVREQLASKGQLIGPNDLLIAVHALTLDLTIVTANTREFSRVPNLRVENWIEQ